MEWEEIFGERVPCAAVRPIEDMFDHPQVLAEDLVATLDHPVVGRYRTMTKPIKFADTPGPPPSASPTFGQHSDEILAAHGYSAAEIAALREPRRRQIREAAALPLLRGGAALCGFRPARGDERQDLFDQAAGLGQHLVVAAGGRAQDEFGDSGGDIGGDALDDRLGVADREIAQRIAAGALLVGFEQPVETGIVRPAEAERDAGAVMVVVDRAALGGGGGADAGDDARRPGPAFRRPPASRSRTARCAGSPPRTSRRSTSADPAAPALARSRRRRGGNEHPRNRPFPRATAGR